MPESKEMLEVPKASDSPLVFISHDSRDADLAEAFSKLLKCVSAGMLKSFWSSDKAGTEGIPYGDPWYNTLMSRLDAASDVVCLLTERSLNRPWILYETGVAKGKRNTPVHGIALGVPLSRASAGPFYQFHNSDDGEESLGKLVLQLCQRVSNLEPDQAVVAGQVQVFKKSEAEFLKNVVGQEKSEEHDAVNEGSAAKVLEEMKLIVRDLPERLGQRIMEGSERIRSRRSPFRRFHPMMVDEMAHMISKRSGDPIAILIIASLFRDDFPWLYEIGMDAYRAVKGRNAENARDALRTFRDAAKVTMRGQFAFEMGFGDKDDDMIMRELPMIINHFMEATLAKSGGKRSHSPRTVEAGDETDVG